MPLISSTAIMALPAVKTLQDCADWSKTVEPFIPQLQAFPQQAAHHLASITDLRNLYASTNPLVSATAFSLFLSPLCLIVSEINRNYSQVDRLWSLLPALYNVHYAIWAHVNGLPTQRVDNIAIISVVWSARLTFNYWRKGGYQKGSEDYRWEILQGWVPKWAFFVFNVTFISTYQNLLLCLVTAPTYITLLSSLVTQPQMSINEVIFARVLLFVIVFEYFADQQQWDFHEAKKAYQSKAKVPQGWTQQQMERGFLTKGLWAYSRHPNFLAEQSIWVLLYVWAAWISGQYFNWSLTGAVNYLMVFQGSTWLTEKLSAGKYPEYKEYQKRVGRFFPSIFGKGVGDWNGSSGEPLTGGPPGFESASRKASR